MTLNQSSSLSKSLFVICIFSLAVLLIHEDLRNAVMPDHFFKVAKATYHDNSSESNNQTKEKQITISYSIRRRSNESEPVDYAQESYNCNISIMNPSSCRDDPSKIIYRRPLKKYFAKLTTDFTTSISTNLNVLVLGDSLGTQFHNMLVTGMGFDPSHDKNILSSFPSLTGELHVSLSVTNSSKIKTNNRLAGWRIYGMLVADNENGDLPEMYFTRGFGWTREQAAKLRGETNETYDTMLLRIPHGHLKIDEITIQDIVETLSFSQELMGVRTVIIATLPLINNILPELVNSWEAKNEELRNWVDQYEAGSIPGIDAVVYIDFARIMNEMVLENARMLYRGSKNKNISESANHNVTNMNVAYETNNTDVDSISRLERLSCEKIPWRWNDGILAQMCSSLPKPPGKCLCPGNSISHDGMHFCPHTFASRFLAGIGCLWKCIYSSSSHKTKIKLRKCQDRCNDKFMTLRHFKITSERYTW